VKGTLLTEYERHLPPDVFGEFVKEYRMRLLSRMDASHPFFFPFTRISAGDNVLKGTREGILKKVQPVSIHGQVTWDVFFTDLEDPDGQISVARVGPEAVMGHNLEPGDRIQIEYLVGVAVRVTRVVPTSSGS
jgi:hypothetical protein